MARIEMKAMEKFPIEKLSYDLKLELLENMDPSDVVQLVNVNQGFRSIVVREPWRIFGKHVDLIWIRMNNQQDFGIKKFKSSITMDGGRRALKRASDDRRESPSHFMELKTGSLLFSKIRSCQELHLSFWGEDQGQEAAKLSLKLLKNLDSVGELEIHVYSAKADIEKYVTILSQNHIESRLFFAEFERNEEMRGVLLNFVETKLKHCKSIEICDYSSHSPWYEPLSKTWTEMIVFRMRLSNNEMESGLVDRIVTKGIPSSNPEAAILVWDYDYSEAVNNSITGLLSPTLGIYQIAHEDRGELQEILKRLNLDELITKNFRFQVNKFRKFLLEGVYFTRPIDSKRKCIYVTEPYVAERKKRYDSFFLAKYITIG